MAYTRTTQGQRFGRLVSIERVAPLKWKFACDCGETPILFADNVKRGLTRSCGCLNSEATKARCYKEDARKRTPEYRTWQSIHQRCGNTNDKDYRKYGGRGIKVCERWAAYENFLADMGKRPEDRSIDRINNDGDYEPSNCRWATVLEQARNKRHRNGWTGRAD